MIEEKDNNKIMFTSYSSSYIRNVAISISLEETSGSVKIGTKELLGKLDDNFKHFNDVFISLIFRIFAKVSKCDISERSEIFGKYYKGDIYITCFDNSTFVGGSGISPSPTTIRQIKLDEVFEIATSKWFNLQIPRFEE